MKYVGKRKIASIIVDFIPVVSGRQGPGFVLDCVVVVDVVYAAAVVVDVVVVVLS